MRRRPIAPRADVAERARRPGFALAGIDAPDDATAELQRPCLAAADHAVRSALYQTQGSPQAADVRDDGAGPPRGWAAGEMASRPPCSVAAATTAATTTAATATARTAARTAGPSRSPSRAGLGARLGFGLRPDL